MSKTKKQYSPQFKAKVALEAVEGVKSIAELSGEYKIHPSMLNKWKRKLIDESVKILTDRHKCLKPLLELGLSRATSP